jgi:hypothetical protein
MNDSFNNDKVNVYLPLRNQAAQTATALLIVLVFGIVQWIRSDQPGQLGLVDYWRFSLANIPNDYKLLVLISAIALPLMLLFTFTALVDRNKINPFILGVLGIIPVLGNFLILSFFAYLILYRGLWSLSEFKNGFSFSPILRTFFFTAIGIYGYKGFAHFYQLKRLLKENKMGEFIDYVDKYKLYKI